jgi:hypothetical protein
MAGEGPSSRKSSAKPTLNAETEIQDVMLYNLHAMRRDDRSMRPLLPYSSSGDGSGKLTFVKVTLGRLR